MAYVDEQALAVQSPHLMPAMSVHDATERFSSLTTFVQQIMREGTDYGPVPGTDKPTLLKPGAEKLTTFFGLRAVPTVIEKDEDWTGERHGGEPFFYYWYRYSLYRGDLLIAEADGSCNSWESKYRYRWAERKCPNCGKTTIIKGKAEYGGGYLCWAKRGGCGAKFKDGDPEVENQELGRIPNPNPADIVNTINKMAQKRALVAATLLAVNASEFFTQDIEDLHANGYITSDVVDVTPIRVETPPPEPPPPPPAKKTNGRPLPADRVRDVIRQKAGWQDGHRLVEGDPPSDGQKKAVASLMGEACGDDKARHDVLAYLFDVISTEELYKRECSAVIDWLKSPIEGDWNLNEYAAAEAANVLRQIAVDQGQQELGL